MGAFSKYNEEILLLMNVGANRDTKYPYRTTLKQHLARIQERLSFNTEQAQRKTQLD